MGPLFNPRRMARTPGFAQEGLYDDLDMAEQDDYERALPSPPPQGGGLSEMLQAAPDAPLPPPRREYDGGPSVDPGPQMRQRITLEAAPLPPKPGLMRKIIGTAAGMYMPQVGREIMAPGYDRQMREYNANKQRMMDEGKLNVQAADEEYKIASTRAAMARAEASGAQKQRAIGQMANDKNYNLGPGYARFDASNNQVAVNKLPEKPVAEPHTFEAAALRAIKIEDPIKRKEALDALFNAKAGMNPEKPIQGVQVGGKGEIVAYTVKPSDVAKKGGSMTVGNVSPRPVKSAGVGGSAGKTTNAVKNNPALFDSLTPTEKQKVISDLDAAGDNDTLVNIAGKRISESAVKTLSGYSSAIKMVNDLKSTLSKNKQYLGPIAGYQALNPYSDANKVRAEINRRKQIIGKELEGGVLRKEDESKYKEILATLNDPEAISEAKMDGVARDLQMMIDENVEFHHKAGYNMSQFRKPKKDSGDGQQRPAKPKLSTLTPPPQGMVYMWKKSAGQLQRVPASKVQSALASKDYEEVK